MATITTRVVGEGAKGSPLTNSEVDNNFINLNTAKYESGDDVSLGSATFTGDVLLNEATPFLRLQESSAGSKRLDLSVNSSSQAKIEANQSASTMIFNVSSNEALRLNYNANGAVFNESGVDRDFRVESDSKSHALFVNGSDGYVGINHDSPAYQLHVNGNFYASTLRSGQFVEYHLSYGSGGGVHFIGQLRPTNYTDGYAHIRLDSSIDHGQGMPGMLEVVVKQRSGNYYGYAWRTGSPQNNNDSRVKLVSTDGGATINVYLEVDDYLTGAIHVTYRSGGNWTSAQSAGSFLESDVIWNSDEHLNSAEHDSYMQINPSGRDFDFYVATNNNGSTLYVDGGSDYVSTGGMGTVTTEGSLRVHAKGANNLNILRSYDQGTGLMLSCTNNGGYDASISAMRGGQNLRIESSGSTTLGLGGDLYIYGENGNNDSVYLRFGSDDVVGATTNDRAQIRYYASNNNSGNLYFYTKKDAGSLYQTQAMYGNGGVVINEDSAAHIDFRVESDSKTHMLFVDAAEDAVGINVSAPTWPLQLWATDTLGSNTNDYQKIARFGGSNGGNEGYLDVIQLRESDSSANWYTTAMRIQTTVDSTEMGYLQFNGNDNSVGVSIGTGGTVSGYHTATENIRFNTNGIVVNEKSADHDFRVESDANTHALFVDAGKNNVSIGTDKAEANLTIRAENSTSYLAGAPYTYHPGGTIVDITAAPDGANDKAALIHFNAYNSNNGATCAYIGAVASPSGNGPAHLVFGRRTGTTAWAENARFDYTGYLIAQKGAVFNESSDNSDFRVESDGQSHALFVDASANNITFGSSNGNSMYNGASTNPGIQFELGYGTIVHQTNGNANYYMSKASGYSNGTFNVYSVAGNSVGSITTNGTGIVFSTTSDRRLKENIEAITDGTDKLMAMRPVTHTWIADKDAPAVHGFIAQEMQEIVPEAVSGDPDGEEMMSMDYGRITPVLVAALQDAHRKIAELESRLTAMEAK